jgi:hypothetical protein
LCRSTLALELALAPIRPVTSSMDRIAHLH